MLNTQYETDRLILTASSPDLTPAVADYLNRNRLFLAPTEPTRDELYYTEAFQRQQLLHDAQCYGRQSEVRLWVAKRQRPERIIGMVHLSGIVLGCFRSCFLGYKLDQAEQNRGYMTEAVARLVRIAFEQLDLHRIEANVMPRNLPSLRVVEKLGFENEGVARAYLKICGKWEDHIHMVLLRPDSPAR